jgi:AraC family transcriptional regulator
MLGPHGQNSRTIYHDAFDNFRFHPSNGLIAETYEGTIGRPAPSGLQLFDYHFAEDRTLRHLVMAAFAMSKYEDHALIGLESLGMALAAHLVGTYCKKASRSSRKPSTPLAAWRLKRVTEYIEARLAHDISLAELSVVAGLSRMHFAAQFRAATGISPHSYVMRQKICAAQTLLSNQFMAIHDIAISVGFKSNAHFARVFQRILGISPIRWRRAINSS